MKRVWLLAAALLGALAGCGPSRPTFLVRLQQDCQLGDRDACGLLAGPPMAPGPQPPFQPNARPRTTVQRDVEAILQGMERGRAPRFGDDPDEGN